MASPAGHDRLVRLATFFRMGRPAGRPSAFGSPTAANARDAHGWHKLGLYEKQVVDLSEYLAGGFWLAGGRGIDEGCGRPSGVSHCREIRTCTISSNSSSSGSGSSSNELVSSSSSARSTKKKTTLNCC
jgi:hypothetical protein